MPDTAKIDLSDYEAAMLRDQHIILTKRSALQKVEQFLGLQVTAIQAACKPLLPVMDENIRSALPKISRGENYLGLPWAILDYPSVFSKQDVFALRTLFWWGNFFSISLQVSGKYLLQFEDLIFQRLKEKAGNFYISVNDDAWQHHFREDNYQPVADFLKASHTKLHRPGHLKLALKFELDDWDKIPSELENGYAALMGLLGTDPVK
jgi:hypothetical protein